MKWISCLIFLCAVSACATRPLPVKKSKRLNDQVWIITGASSGLGRGIALAAAKSKAKVVLVARGEKALLEVAKEIEAMGGTSKVFPADISDSNALKALLAATIAEWGRVDVWVNNAGVTVFGNYWETPLAEHQRVIDVNVKGSMSASYLALRQFITQEEGMLINIVSAESRLPAPYQAAYAVSKAGLKSLGIVLRQELRLSKHKCIAVISVDPWALNTPIWDNAANHTGHAPRMGMMDRTAKAVNAVMHAAAGKKKRDIAVGWKTHAAYTLHRVAPNLAYNIAAKIVHKHQIKHSPQAADTPGNLFRPSAAHAVETDVKERIKKERKLRKKQE
ncbi:MAG: SDR family NAD(P)-dependent oxidoreductase [Sphingobacteriales bacterium]|nr:MAG: SDR family NAD(P)-dependent oxidoreductase [Sphingobacteriales bacterium]